MSYTTSYLLAPVPGYKTRQDAEEAEWLDRINAEWELHEAGQDLACGLSEDAPLEFYWPENLNNHE